MLDAGDRVRAEPFDLAGELYLFDPRQEFLQRYTTSIIYPDIRDVPSLPPPA
jgi:hypothetical protein